MTNTFSTTEIVTLIDKYLYNSLTLGEMGQLQRWLDEHEDNFVYFNKITSPGVLERMTLGVLAMNKKSMRKKFEARRGK